MIVGWNLLIIGFELEPTLLIDTLVDGWVFNGDGTSQTFTAQFALDFIDSDNYYFCLGANI